ncbi:MAG TPA: alkaline phosphatase family protein [Candidatus Krumholzibacteria bacterium]|nr:alkaline phosphatase family protein [Candidatus Krumholzibacteria bacterium]
MPRSCRFLGRRLLRRALLFASLLLLFACEAGHEPPRLLVVIVVDQLRADLLRRYDNCFTGGFRRLLDQGGGSTAAVHDHAITDTAPGHATLATGVHPSRHGIVDNAWCESRDGHVVVVPCVADSSTRILGAAAIGASPRHLQVPGLADWLRAAGEHARVVALGGKDRSAILLAGKGRGDVYWFSRAEGRFVTSTYYRDDYPEWLERFQHGPWLGFCRDSTWTCTVPAGLRSRARGAAALPAADPHERSGGAEAARSSQEAADLHSFTHAFAVATEDFWTWWLATPALDEATLALAQEAVRSCALGKDTTPDLLALGLSQTDRIGHRYGPLSLEQLDHLLRLDRALGEFFASLDTVVGKGRWLVGLSADHGVTDTAADRREDGVPVQVLDLASVDSLFADLQALDGTGAAREELAAARVVRCPYVAAAFTHTEVMFSAPGDSFLDLFRHSYYAGRFPMAPLGSSARRRTLGVYGVEARLQSWATWSEAGADHGSPYLPDRQVPMLFLGAGVRPGSWSGHLRTVDFAPTLLQMLRLPVPAGLDGHPY